MKKKYFYLMAFSILGISLSANAQNYTPQVSKDSIGILNKRLEALKANVKLQELKIKEYEEETNVEKLRIKLLAANASAKASAAKNSDMANKLSSGNIDAKTRDKIAKAAKNDMADSQKALERHNKQIAKVEAIRNEIRAEERKLTAQKTVVFFNEK